MIFWLYALEKGIDAKPAAVFCVICAVLYLAVCLILRPNRKQGVPAATLAELAAAEFLCALFWLRVFFPGGEYVNPGLGGMAWILLYPASLAVVFLCAMLLRRLLDLSGEGGRNRNSEK